MQPETFMHRALELARRGRGRVEPNPMVGAVVVQDGEIVGEGWHDSYGSDHAEVAALTAAGDRTDGATIFVTLEPCSTAGKTPACTESLIAAKVARVVYASVDPNPAHAGGADEVLRSAGIEVESGLLAEEGDELLDDFRRHLELDRPVVVAKWASTLDARIATASGESRWITGPKARRQGHEERSRSEAVLVGIETVLADDPLLDARLLAGRDPRPVVLDSALRLPLDSRLVRERDPIVVAAEGRFDEEARRALSEAGVEVVVVAADAHGRPEIQAALAALRARGVHRLMVEGGGKVLGSLFAADVVDLVQLFLAPTVIGDPAARPAIAGPALPALADATRLEFIEQRLLDDDLFCTLRVLR